MSDDKFVFQPIGVIHSPHKKISKIPIQPVFCNDIESTVILNTEYADEKKEKKGTVLLKYEKKGTVLLKYGGEIKGHNTNFPDFRILREALKRQLIID